jgi:hypothetical protein
LSISGHSDDIFSGIYFRAGAAAPLWRPSGRGLFNVSHFSNVCLEIKKQKVKKNSRTLSVYLSLCKESSLMALKLESMNWKNNERFVPRQILRLLPTFPDAAIVVR